MTQFSDTIRNGDAFYGRAGQSDGGDRGFPMAKIAVYEYGAIATLTSSGVCTNATATAAGAGSVTLSATGSLVSGGVATFDIPRNVTISATANTTQAIVFLVTGTDAYGATQTESITATVATTLNGAKAFKTITSVVATTTGAHTTATPIQVGTGSLYGLPFHLADKGKFLFVNQDGVNVPPTLVNGLTTTDVSTSTTADVRGTLTTSTVANGSLRFTVGMLVNPSTKAKLYGADPA